VHVSLWVWALFGSLVLAMLVAVPMWVSLAVIISALALTVTASLATRSPR
jgi:hypothetical protein